ncbi:MAG: hypothetical protein AAFV69_02215 [Pseudomonadota bacterium]
MFSKIRAFSIAIATTLAVFAGPTIATAGDVPQAVKNACRGDFIRHCITHEPGTSGARDCMAGVFHKLSNPCTSAILNSDLVNDEAASAEPKTNVARSTKSAKSKRQRKSASARKTNQIRSAKRYKPKKAGTKKRRVAKQGRKARMRKFARHIKRGTRIAGRKIARAFKKAFR